MPRVLMLLVGCALAAAGCDAHPQPNVVLILVDTLRADRTTIHGYERATTPHLATRARSAVVFEGAHSQAPCTFPSVNSLLTSREPFHFYDQPVGSFAIPASIPTLAEILGRSGYATFAVSASSVVRATPSKVNKAGGFGAGFATFDESCESRDATCVNSRAIALARAAPAPFFAYLHYMDPHHPYASPPGFRNHFAKPDPRMPRRILDGDPGPILASLYNRKEKRDWTREVAYLSDAYDDEIRSLDAALDLLLEQLPTITPDRDTIVILASDHGEDFLEHGHLMHCRSLYETSLHVPLVMWLPGMSGRRIAAPVQNVDIVPTLLDYLGIEAPGLDGRSLRALIDGRGEQAPAYAALYAQRATIDGQLKLLYDLDRVEARLFDLVADPGERNDLAGVRSEQRDVLEQRLLEHVAATEGGGGTANAAHRAKQVQERLKAIGYLE
jgi:arylsulfatase A-like enzyme